MQCLWSERRHDKKKNSSGGAFKSPHVESRDGKELSNSNSKKSYCHSCVKCHTKPRSNQKTWARLVRNDCIRYKQVPVRILSLCLLYYLCRGTTDECCQSRSQFYLLHCINLFEFGLGPGGVRPCFL